VILQYLVVLQYFGDLGVFGNFRDVWGWYNTGFLCFFALWCFRGRFAVDFAGFSGICGDVGICGILLVFSLFCGGLVVFWCNFGCFSGNCWCLGLV